MAICSTVPRWRLPFFSRCQEPRFFRTVWCFNWPTSGWQIAPECSGIHSALVLFITSLIGQLCFSANTVEASGVHIGGDSAGHSSQWISGFYHRRTLYSHRTPND